MAQSLDGATKVNPRFVKGTVPQAIDLLPTDTATYKSGELGETTTAGKHLAIADDAADVSVMFASTRDAALTATADKGYRIDTDSQYMISVVNGTADAAASRTMVGALYSIEVISNVACLDLDTAAAHSNDIFKVDGLMSDLEPKRHAIADSPGHVYGHFVRTASNDANAA